MTMDEKAAELRRITKELEAFVGAHCTPPSAESDDPVNQSCNDAALMLRDALNRLEQSG